MKPILNAQIDLNRIEFFITYKCTSRCDHCSVYSIDTQENSGPIDLVTAENIINDACDNYKINSVMTFGGEPLLYPDLVCKIHNIAKNCDIPVRQIITNGYWSNNKNRINEIVSMITDVEVNNILVSIDCFHEKYLNYEIVKYTIEQLKKRTKAKLQLHPVWVRTKDDNNPYNERTKKVLSEFEELGILINEGNILFPSGRALINLSDYLPRANISIIGTCKDQPYTDMPNDIRSICVEPNGDIVACNAIGNIYEKPFKDILRGYDYKKDQVLKAMIERGSEGLYSVANENNLELSSEDYYTVCELCKDVSKKLREKCLTTVST